VQGQDPLEPKAQSGGKEGAKGPKEGAKGGKEGVQGERGQATRAPWGERADDEEEWEREEEFA